MKHTPGPWEASQEWPKNIADAWYVHDTTHGIQIAEIYGSGNAHLIAAAPDLLEACELVADNVHSGSIGIEFSTWQKILAAIAKAKSENKRQSP